MHSHFTWRKDFGEQEHNYALSIRRILICIIIFFSDCMLPVLRMYDDLLCDVWRITRRLSTISNIQNRTEIT